MTSDSSISIIVCTRNRAASLQRTIDAIGKLRIPVGWESELVVVDNGSTDETPALAQNMRLANMAVRYLAESKPGLSNARNAGLSCARGEFILFTDDDALPAEDWVEQIVSAFIADGYDAVTGKFTPAPQLMRNWMTPMHRGYLGDSVEYAPVNGVWYLIGGNMAFRRTVLERVPAFDPELGAGALGFAEETLFGRQLSQAGFKVGYAPNARVIHDFHASRLTRAHWLATARKHGRTDAYVRYHWEYEDITFPRIKWIYNVLKLHLRRLLQRPPSLEDEGFPLWEMCYVKRIEMYAQFCKERRRPRNYEQYGLTKRGSHSQGIE
jgi:glycosyltransferase involved in cell wall biosynthesis